MTKNNYETFDVEVLGGKLRVGRWRADAGDSPIAVGLHGVTATHMSWSAIAASLAGVTLVAPDLRGRGKSSSLGGPYSMEAHVSDTIAVLDHLGLEKVTVVGMSMGGFVSTVLATKHPDRVEQLVLLDGGIPIPVPPGMEPDQLLEALLGPSIERLQMTFASVRDYFEFWKVHPALSEAGSWNEHIEANFEYDLVGDEPRLRSSVSEESVRGDSRDLLTNKTVLTALEKIRCPVLLLRAPRGLQNGAPVYPDFLIDEAKKACPQLIDELVEDTNHYTLCLAKGAPVVAARIQQSVAALTGVEPG